ncbi:uncharacterized protein C8A04DRAFT_13030 [Dichotomopilus funicola]|uniref:Uncharacterized protein n=1 Tax=Dichotomopilus funicola TaxID=1934379 RepID=A0AAN6V0T3_9PEZI|nr:hypothetical protein C8A04DRAFT_13030 [Dichotomopilus funicola]
MSFALTLVAAQSTGLLTLFLVDSEPLSLEASAVAVNTVGSGLNANAVTTLEVACPTAASPANDDCRAAGIYPAQVFHTQGSVWGGTTTEPYDDSTTTWYCALGGSEPTLTAACNKTIVSGIETVSVVAGYDNCYVAAHQRPIVVTAGLEKINPAHFMDLEASEYLSIRSSQLSEDGCPSSKSLIWPGTVSRYSTSSPRTGTSSSSTRTSASPSGTPSSSSTITAGPGSGVSGTKPTQTQTETTLAASTSSPNSAGSTVQLPSLALLVGAGMAAAAGFMIV